MCTEKWVEKQSLNMFSIEILKKKNKKNIRKRNT